MRDHRGDPVRPPGSVQASVAIPGEDDPLQTTTEVLADGSYRFDDLPTGRLVHVWARAKGSDAFGRDLDVPLVPDGAELLDIELPRGVVVVGVVLDKATREPVPFAQVWAENYDYDEDSNKPSTIADAQGRFRLEGVEEDRNEWDGNTYFTCHVMAGSDTHAPSPLMAYGLQPNERGECELELLVEARSCSFSGVLYEPDGTTPARSVRMWAIDAQNNYQIQSSNRDGSFSFEGLPAGRFSIAAYRLKRNDAGEHTSLEHSEDLVPGDTAPRRLVLLAGGRTAIEGRVVDLDGNPVARVSVKAHYDFDAGGLAIGLDGEIDTTGEDGRFRFTGMRPGSYRLQPQIVTSIGPRTPRPVCSRPHDIKLELVHGEVARDLELVVADCMQVSGTVRLNGRDHGDLALHLVDRRTRETVETSGPEDDGTFRMDSVLESSYDLILYEGEVELDLVPVDREHCVGVRLVAPVR